MSLHDNRPGTLDFITGESAQHIAITGAGTIDGQGKVWWENRNDFRPHTVQFSHVTYALIRFDRSRLRSKHDSMTGRPLLAITV